MPQALQSQATHSSRLAWSVVRACGLVVSAVVFWGCASRVPPVVSAADVAWAQQRWPEVSHQDLERGRSLLQAKCGNGCHLPPSPRDRAAAEWPRHVAEMSVRAGLTGDSRRLVEHYLVTLARTEPKPTSL
jgi:hypothetical protein